MIKVRVMLTFKNLGGTWTEFGDNTTQQEWDDLVDFIVDNDMTVDANYEYVKEVYNTGSLIDYFLHFCELLCCCNGLVGLNTAWWRGKILRVIRRSGDMLAMGHGCNFWALC